MFFFILPGLIAAFIAWKRGEKKFDNTTDRVKDAFVWGVITSVVFTVIIYANYAP